MLSMQKELDGGHDEGGGQIVRNGISYSALLQLPLMIRNIRANRPKPGLKNQHLAGIRLVNDICKGKLKGDELHSQQIVFKPSSLKPAGASYMADSTTAGAITLLIQVSFPVLLFCPSPSLEDFLEGDPPLMQTVDLKGGTDVPFSPPIDYICHVFNPLFSRMFCDGQKRCLIQIDRRGFMARGGGQVRMQVQSLLKGEYLKPAVLLERGKVIRIRGSVYTAGTLDHKITTQLKKHVIDRLCQAGYGYISTLSQDIVLTHHSGEHGASSSGINLWAETSTGCIFGGGILGRPKKSREQDAQEACEELLRNLRHGGCVDEYYQDMMIIFMALAKGHSRVVTGPLTQHTTTAIHVAKQMTGVEFQCTRLETIVDRNEVEACSQGQNKGQEKYLIECDGIGFVGK
ncbi:hypothetical protein BGZ94_005797 [Podila epigama]|nr:hypothetical protein BGZ94_005797 [Podila epigama]